MEADGYAADHIPLAFTFNVDVLPSITRNDSNTCSGKLNRSTLSKKDLLTYYLVIDKLLSNIYLPINGTMMPIIRVQSIRIPSVPCIFAQRLLWLKVLSPVRINAMHHTDARDAFLNSDSMLTLCRTRPAGYREGIHHSQQAT